MKEQILLYAISFVGLIFFVFFINFIIALGGIANVPGDHNPGMTWSSWFLIYGTVWIILVIIAFFNIRDWIKNK